MNDLTPDVPELILCAINIPSVREWLIRRLKNRLDPHERRLIWDYTPNVYFALAQIERRVFPVLVISYPASNAPLLDPANRGSLREVLRLLNQMSGLVHMRIWNTVEEQVWTIEPNGMISPIQMEV